MTERLGFVGLGSMGGPMCLNLLRNGFEATVFDVVAGAADPHLKAGAKQAQCLGDVARNSDVVLTMLPKSDDVETVILGEGGIAANGRDGMLVIDMSTIFPGTSTKAAAVLNGQGYRVSRRGGRPDGDARRRGDVDVHGRGRRGGSRSGASDP